MKKGFTLIELVAVIVILGIIALIVTPVVLNVIDSSKKQAKIESAKMYVKNVNNTIMNERANNDVKVEDGTYDIMSNGNVCIGEYIDNNCVGYELIIYGSGKKPSSGKIQISNYIVVENENTYFNYEDNFNFTYDDSGNIGIDSNDDHKKSEENPPSPKLCTYIDNNSNNSLDVGEKVTCESDSFYVISNPTNGKVDMICEWSINTETNQQIEENYTLLPFANDIKDIAHFDSYPYDASITDNLEINTYINNYVNRLNNSISGLDASGRLIYHSELVSLCGNDFDCSSGPDWVTNSVYWTYTVEAKEGYVYGMFGEFQEIFGFDFSMEIGLRPVITISTNVIEI